MIFFFIWINRLYEMTWAQSQCAISKTCATQYKNKCRVPYFMCRLWKMGVVAKFKQITSTLCWPFFFLMKLWIEMENFCLSLKKREKSFYFVGIYLNCSDQSIRMHRGQNQICHIKWLSLLIVSEDSLKIYRKP